MLKRLALIVLLLVPNLVFALAIPVQEYTLANGLHVFVRVNHRAPVVVFQIWYKVGSSYEYDGITGISHVLEHLMFTGTKRFPAGQIENLVRARGGEENAVTSQDYTMYYEILPAANLALSFELEADRMSNLNLTQANLQKALAVVKEEKRLRIDNNPQAVLLTRFNALAYIASPYQHPPIGWLSDLNHMQLADVQFWYHTWYVPNNAIIVVTGDVNPNTVYDLANKYFDNIKPKSLPRLYPAVSEGSFGARKIAIKKPAKLSFLIMGYNVPSYKTAANKQEVYALYVAQAILAGSDSSWLQSQLVRNKEIAAAIDSDYTMMQLYSSEFTLLGVPATGKSLQDLRKAFLQQIKVLQTQPVTASELARIKAQVIAAKIYQRDSLFSQAKEIGYLEVLGLPWQIGEEFVSQIKLVTAAQIQAVAKKYFVPARQTVAELEPK